MDELVPTRVVEICPGEWAVQFQGGLNGWVQLGDVFDTKEEAEAFEAEQRDSADFGDE